MGVRQRQGNSRSREGIGNTHSSAWPSGVIAESQSILGNSKLQPCGEGGACAGPSVDCWLHGGVCADSQEALYWTRGGMCVDAIVGCLLTSQWNGYCTMGGYVLTLW